MTDEEKRELDAFCAESVLGLRAVKTVMVIEAGTFALVRHGENKGTVFVHDCMNNIKPFKPTVNPADAMAMLEWIIQVTKKSVCQCVCSEGFEVYHGGSDYIKTTVRAKTLPLAICKFAKQLFSK